MWRVPQGYKDLFKLRVWAAKFGNIPGEWYYGKPWQNSCENRLKKSEGSLSKLLRAVLAWDPRLPIGMIFIRSLKNREQRSSEEQLHRLRGYLNSCYFWSPKKLEFSYVPTEKFKDYCVGALFECSMHLEHKQSNDLQGVREKKCQIRECCEAQNWSVGFVSSTYSFFCLQLHPARRK